MCHDVSPQALTRPRDRGNLRSPTRRNSPTVFSSRAVGPPEPASSRRSRANGCSPGELMTAPSRKPQEFRKRLGRWGYWTLARAARRRLNSHLETASQSTWGSRILKTAGGTRRQSSSPKRCNGQRGNLGRGARTTSTLARIVPATPAKATIPTSTVRDRRCRAKWYFRWTAAGSRNRRSTTAAAVIGLGRSRPVHGKRHPKVSLFPTPALPCLGVPYHGC